MSTHEKRQKWYKDKIISHWKQKGKFLVKCGKNLIEMKPTEVSDNMVYGWTSECGHDGWSFDDVMRFGEINKL